MWLLYALTAAILWGVSYAASGRVLERGISPLALYFCYGIFGVALGGIALMATGKLLTIPADIRALQGDWIWFVISIVGAAVGALLIYMAIGEKNATVASLIEVSYPIFVALFAWIFFREVQFNLQTVIGGALILSGVGVVFLGNRH